MAVSTSCSLTYSRRCMAACASLMRMMDSRWRTAMGMPWLTALSRLSSAYTCSPQEYCHSSAALNSMLRPVPHTEACPACMPGQCFK